MNSRAASVAAANVAAANVADTEAHKGPLVMEDYLTNMPPLGNTVRTDLVEDGEYKYLVVYASGVPRLMEPPPVKIPFGIFGQLIWTAVSWASSASAAIGTNWFGVGKPVVASQINNAVDYVKQTGYEYDVPIILAGYSEGGQQMQIYATSGLYRDQVDMVFTFGSPIVKTASQYSSKTYQVVHFQDPNDPVFGPVLRLFLANNARKTFPVLSFESPSPLRARYTAEGGSRGWNAHYKENYLEIAKTFSEHFGDTVANPEDLLDGMGYGGTVVKSWSTYYQ